MVLVINYYLINSNALLTVWLLLFQRMKDLPFYLRALGNQYLIFFLFLLKASIHSFGFQFLSSSDSVLLMLIYDHPVTVAAHISLPDILK